MTADLLVCPGCRTHARGEDGVVRVDVRSLERRGDTLVCDCGRRYPVVDELPIVMADPSGFLRNEIAAILERDLAPSLAQLLVEDQPDDAAYPRLLEHLSIYLDAHWGDRAKPPPDGPGAGFALGPLVEKIADRARERVDAAVELGCSAGRILCELADGAERVVGIDLQFGVLRRARKLLAGERLAFNRRVAGRHYAIAELVGRRASGVSLVCGDALDPPLVPRAFDRVVALNVLDSVARPRQLLAVASGLCKPGGELILASPYNWQTGVVEESQRIGGADPASALVELLTSGAIGAPFTIEDEAELPWTLRRDARSAVAYRTHYVRARKSR
jgi:SAM-dependent methyltransferase